MPRQQHPPPPRDGFRDTRVPDGDRGNFAAGAGYKVSDALTLDAAVNYIAVKDATIDRPGAAFAGTPVQTLILTNGQLDKAHVVVLGLGAKLAF